MSKLKVGVVGVGSIAQVVHIPVLKKIPEVELTAICDIDDNKIGALTERFEIPNGYKLIDDMINQEALDVLHICTHSFYHYPMAYMALNNGINVLIEKPAALNAQDVEKLNELAEKKKLNVLVGMHNRFREDVLTLKEFIRNQELGDIFYIKTGWLKKWLKSPIQPWQGKKDYAGGGVLIDMGTPLIDLALFLMELPKIKSVRMYDYSLNPEYEVEDAALAVIHTKDNVTITVELSWRMHTDRDMVYTHLFGKKGSAYLNPLRIQKELHGKLVNVTPMTDEDSSRDRYFRAYEREIQHFIRVIEKKEKNRSSLEDAVYLMRLIDALYESANNDREIHL